MESINHTQRRSTSTR